jgi:hypothetical protein
MKSKMEETIGKLEKYIDEADSKSFSDEMDNFHKWVDGLEIDEKKEVLIEMFPKIQKLLPDIEKHQKMAEDFLVNGNNKNIANEGYSKY